jgi:hypothetical protein
VDGDEEGAHHRAGDSHLGQLQVDGVGIMNDTPTVLLRLRYIVTSEHSTTPLIGSLHGGYEARF